MHRTLLPLLALAFLAGAAPQDPETYAGHYTVSWEVVSFRPCGSSEAWWVADAGELGSRYRAVLGGSEFGTVYARVRAEVSGRGRFGHMGQYTRLLSVKEVLEVRERGDGDCRAREATAR
ncbi:MAG TPA: hypothetical protein VFX98_14025 [Longimicrobiaceae bacterium]|nr:hypothetical protein [Longimicrobiaceae bacterium]